jgi:integrase
MAEVQGAMAREFFKAEETRGISPKTYNNTLIFLRSAFENLRKEAGMPENPFDGLPTREEDTVFRKPFNAEELAAIIKAADSDPLFQPIIVTAICTAMRRGDCCLLRWTAVDLPNRFIKVKTSKTGEEVQIPIFPLLNQILAKAERTKSPFVFPKQAALYETNPDAITARVRRVLRGAGFFDAESDDEKLVSRGEVHQERANGLRKASVRDFHSFRVSWVTLALSAGVPVEIVQKVTGHRTAGIVMKHYFQPSREEFRRTLASKLPALLSGTAEPKPIDPEELKTKLKSMASKSWESVKDELLQRLTPP